MRRNYLWHIAVIITIEAAALAAILTGAEICISLDDSAVTVNTDQGVHTEAATGATARTAPSGRAPVQGASTTEGVDSETQ